MKRTIVLLTVLCFFAIVFAHPAFTQTQKPAPKAVNVTGTWDVTMKLPTANVPEKWVVRQVGDKISGTATTADGDLPIVGEMVTNIFFRVSVKNGDDVRLIRATVEKDSMDGSITMNKSEYVWSAKKEKATVPAAAR